MSTPPASLLVRSLLVATAACLLSQELAAQCLAWDVDAIVPQYYDRLGASVDGHNGSLVVGVPGHFGQGEALVFDITASGAVQTGLLWPSDIGAQDQFGQAVAIRGDVIVVGCPGDDAGAFGAGSAYAYERFFGVWLKTAKLQASVPTSSASFGSCVAVGDTWIAVGAPFDSSAAPFAGLVSLFQKTTAGWVLRQEEFGLNAYERFGSALAIRGGTLAVGAPGDGAGRVDLFEMGQLTWTPGPVLTPTGGSSTAEFGSSVDVFANRVLVGARSDSLLAPNAGAAYLFANTGTGWKQRQRFVPQQSMTADRFGAAVAIEDEILLVGAPGSDAAAPDAGEVHVFTESTVELGGFPLWVEKSSVTPLGAQAGTQLSGGFGSALAVDKFRFWVGSPDEDTSEADAGRVRTYTMTDDGCASLSVGPPEVSAHNPVQIDFELRAPAGLGGLPYFLLGSASGSTPGILIGSVLLPLELPDLYGDLLLFGANHGAVQNNLAYLDADGCAEASIDLAALGYPLLQGTTLTHSYFVFHAGGALYASPPVSVQIFY